MSDRHRRDSVIQRYQWQTKGFFTAQKIRAQYYLPTPRKGVSNMANDELVTEAQARQLAREYGTSPDEIEREIARDYRGATWYWSPGQRALVSVYDGETTVRDLSDAMARGPLDERQEAMAADFWAMAAQQAHTTAAAAWDAVWDETEDTPQAFDALTAAGISREVLADLQSRAQELNHVADLVADQRIAETIAHSQAVRAIYDELIDRPYYEGLDNNTGRQDDYSDQIWGQAVDLVDNGKTVEEVRATAETKRVEDDALEDAYYNEIREEIAAAEQAQREADGPTGRAWRTAAAITYREHVIEDYGNDGRPEDDRHLSPSEVAARAMAVATIAGATGVPEGYVFAELRAAAVAEGSAPGSDNDPDYLAPPNWETFVDQYNQYETDSVALAFEGGPAEDRADDVVTGAQPDTGQAAPSIETAEYWLARGEVDPGAGLSEEMPPEWTPETGPQWPVEPRWTSEAGQARLEAKWAAEDAAYAAEQTQIAALPADERQDRAIESVAGFVVDAPPAASTDDSDRDAVALHDELTEALDQARARLAAGDVPEADRAAHEARIEQLEAETTPQPYPQEYSAADDPYDHEFHHGRTADLPAVSAEYTEHPDAYRSGPAATSAEVPAFAGSWDGASSGVTAGMSPADMHAAVLDQLDKARDRLAAGNSSPEWVREQAEYVEHLEEWAYVAGEFAADQSTGDKLGEEVTDAPLAAVEDTAAADRVSALVGRTGERMTAEWAAQVPGRDPAMWRREPSSAPDVSGESYAVDPRLLATAEAIAEALRGGDLDGVQRLQAALYDDGPPADTASVPADTDTVEDTAGLRDGWEGWADHWDQERDAGESPGKSRVAEAVAAAHAAVEADSKRAAEQLGEQQQPSRAGDWALTDAVEQAPTMEWGA
jgi:hypothetical protein